MSVADKMSQAYLLGSDDQKRRLAKEINAQENELKALRERNARQARIIASMQKQLEKANKRIAEIYEEVEGWRPEQNLDA